MQHIIELYSGNTRATISTRGAELTSLITGDQSIIWKRDDAIWPRTAPVLFPIVGKLKENSFLFEGRKYSLPQHGFARDSEFEVVKQQPNVVTLMLSSPFVTSTNFPFEFELYITFELLENALLIDHEVVALPNEKLFFSLGVHPAFHIETDISNYYLQFDNPIHLDRQYLENGLLNGKMVSYGFTNLLDLSEKLFEEDALVFIKPSCKSIQLIHRPSSQSIQIHAENMTALGIWKKPNAPFLCIEPWWGWADSVTSNSFFEEKPGIHCLENGDKKLFSYSIEW